MSDEKRDDPQRMLDELKRELDSQIEQDAATPPSRRRQSQNNGPQAIGDLLNTPTMKKLAKPSPTLRVKATVPAPDTEDLLGPVPEPEATPNVPVEQKPKKTPRVLQGDLLAYEEPEEIVYQHSVLCQTVLPYRDPKGLDTWSRVQGDAHLSLTAGEAFDGDKMVRVPLPFGPKARLALYHLNTLAVLSQSRHVEVGDSLTAFVKRIGLAHHGRNVRTVKEQLSRLSACRLTFGMLVNGRPRTVKADIVRGFELWESNHEDQRVLWPSIVTFSQDYFDSLVQHAVPLNETAVARLSHSAMGLDIYTWLAQRLHRVKPERNQFIPWPRLHEQFGQNYARLRKFREVFKDTLKQVYVVYPEARFKVDHRGMFLAHSKPPVAKKRLLSLKPDAR